jgi:hypothetical protein
VPKHLLLIRDMTLQSPAVNRARTLYLAHVHALTAQFLASKHLLFFPNFSTYYHASPQVHVVIVVLYFFQKNKSSWCSATCIKPLSTCSKLVCPNGYHVSADITAVYVHTVDLRYLVMYTVESNITRYMFSKLLIVDNPKCINQTKQV